MSIYAELNRNPSRRDLANFGLVVGVGMAVLAAWFHLRAHRQIPALVLLTVGAMVFVLARIPPIGRILYVLWMGLGLTLGAVTGPIAMLVIYVVVIVPVGAWFKLRQRDTMHRQPDRAATSYWEDYPRAEDPARYMRQF
jgi:hypothetical protein